MKKLEKTTVKKYPNIMKLTTGVVFTYFGNIFDIYLRAMRYDELCICTALKLTRPYYVSVMTNTRWNKTEKVCVSVYGDGGEREKRDTQ